MIINNINNLEFAGLYNKAKRTVTIYNHKFDGMEQLSRVHGSFIDSYPPFFLDLSNPKNIRQRLYEFCNAITPVTYYVSQINQIKYGCGDDFNYDNSDDCDNLSASDCQKLLKEDEIKILEKSIEKNLKTRKIIPLSTKLKVTFATKDEPKKITHYGIGYKLSFINTKTKQRNDLFLKIFHANHRQNPTHGAIPEILNNIFINHNFPNNKNFQNFYFGNTNSFMVTDFILPNKKFNGIVYPEKLLGITLTDHTISQNKIGDFYIDCGGVQKRNQLAYDTVARGIAKKIYRTPKNERLKLWNKLWENNIGNKESVVSGLTYGIEYLSENIQDKYYKKVIKSEYAKNPKVITALFDTIGDKKLSKISKSHI